MKKHLLLFALLAFYSGKGQVPKYTAKVFDNSLKGYYFLFAKNSNLVLDENGTTIYYAPVGPFGVTFNLLENGWMVYSVPPNFYFLDSTFRIVDSIRCKNNVITDPHEIRVLPNGHFLLLGMDSFKMDLSKYFWKGQYGSDTALVQCAVIQELDAKRNVVFEWHGKDHFAFSDIDTFFLTSSLTVDFTHSNALELDTDGNILLCSRNLNEITKINRKDGSVMWRFGGNKNQFRFINWPVPFYGQHDIRRLANGHFTLFDNGNHMVSHGARALEFELDEKSKTASLKWSYTLDPKIYSSGRGSVQRVGDRAVISYGQNPAKVCFVVVDTGGTKLLKVDGLAPYRVLYHSALPWQLHRPNIACIDSSGTLYLDAGKGYSSYLWNSGDSSRIIRASSSTSYQVFVPYGQGVIGSEKVETDDSAISCRVLNLNPKNNDSRKSKPNEQPHLKRKSP